jgi:hypothetical protein
MAESYTVAKAVWTEADFDEMGWHDARIWAMAFPIEEHEFVLDVDYILQWIDPAPGNEHFTFWVIPATVVFENVVDLELSLEPYADLTIADIHRDDPGTPRNSQYIAKTTDWKWTIDCHVGHIAFRAAGYRQYLRGAAVLTESQHLTLSARGGISFSRSTHRAAAV